jgi:hypothetical protein
MENAKFAYNALTTSLNVYFLGDEKKTPQELEANAVVTKTTRVENNRKGTIEIKYTQVIPTRAKPLTALDLCFSGEHTEAAGVAPSKPLGFLPTQSGSVMYYEITISSLAKRHGGATIGFAPTNSTSMPGVSWYTYGFSLDSGIARNGVGFPPEPNVHKKPKVGDVFGVGYIVHLAHTRFLDDNRCPHEAGDPYSLSFFVTRNGVLKYLIDVPATPITMQPAIMLCNTNDGILFNFSGDASHPFTFDLNQISRWKRTPFLSDYLCTMAGTPVVQYGPRHQDSPIDPSQPSKPLSYIPIRKKTIDLTTEELSTFGTDRFASLVGSHTHLFALTDALTDKCLPFTVAGEIVDLDIHYYYNDLCSLLKKDEAVNVLLHVNPKLSPEEGAALLNAEAPQEQLRTYTGEMIIQRALSAVMDFEIYVRDFATVNKLRCLANGLPPVPHPDSHEWVKTLFHPDFPFPISMDCHRAMRASRVLHDSFTFQLGGIYQNAHANLESVLGRNLVEIIQQSAQEVAWAEAQCRKLALGLPTTTPPSRSFAGIFKCSKEFALINAPSYAAFFDMLTILERVKLVDLDEKRFPSPSKIEQWALTLNDNVWLELFLWNGLIAIPLSSETLVDFTKPLLPGNLIEAFTTLLGLMEMERQRLTNAALEPSNTAYLEMHVKDLLDLIRQCDEGVTYSTHHMVSLGTETQIMDLPPLPIPTDPIVSGKPELKLHGYRYVIKQIKRLQFLFGRHSMLLPLISWLELKSAACEANALSYIRSLVKLSPPKNPIIPNETWHMTPLPTSSRMRRMRPAFIAFLGLAAVATIGAAAWLGLKLGTLPSSSSKSKSKVSS